MIRHSKQSGFTAVELLITLFVAAGFLIASYQLFNLIIKDSGSTRAESRAGNVANDYMRRYISSATSPCTVQNPLSNSAITVEGLTAASVSVAITCPVTYSLNTVSQIEVAVKYNYPEQTVKYATYTIGSSTAVSDVVNGLVGWWKFNGNTSPTVGPNTGTLVGTPTLTTGQNGTASGAYNFSGGSSEYIDIGDFAALPMKSSARTLCAWGKPSNVTSGSRWMVAYGTINSSKGMVLGMNGTSVVAGSQGTNVTVTSVWAAGVWHQVCMSWNGTTTTLYVDGVSRSTTAQTWDTEAGDFLISNQIGAATESWVGAIDDVRIYNRAISQAEATTLFSLGAR